jgi:hypothetical protein
VVRVDGDGRQACVDQPLTQDVRVGDLELQHRLVLPGPLELGHHRLDCADEKVQRLELGRVAVGDEENASAGPGHPDHLTQRPGLIRNEHTPNCEPVTS